MWGDEEWWGPFVRGRGAGAVMRIFFSFQTMGILGRNGLWDLQAWDWGMNGNAEILPSCRVTK